MDKLQENFNAFSVYNPDVTKRCAARSNAISRRDRWKRETDSSDEKYDRFSYRPKQLSNLITEYFGYIKKNQKDKEHLQHIREEFKSVIGESSKDLVEIVDINEWVISAKVKSQILYTLLKTYDGARILSEMRKKYPIRHINYFLG